MQGSQVRAVTAITHCAGLDVRVDQQLRQRCAWCGATLIDYDLSRIAVPAGQDPTPATWPVGALVTVDGNASWTPEQQDDSKLPDDACARLDHAVTV